MPARALFKGVKRVNIYNLKFVYIDPSKRQLIYHTYWCFQSRKVTLNVNLQIMKFVLRSGKTGSSLGNGYSKIQKFSPKTLVRCVLAYSTGVFIGRTNVFARESAMLKLPKRGGNDASQGLLFLLCPIFLCHKIKDFARPPKIGLHCRLGASWC